MTPMTPPLPITIAKSLEMLRPHWSADHAMHAAHSEIVTALERLTEQNVAVKAAVLYVLDRIKRDKDVRFHCGYGTETFSLLVRAAALLLEQTVEEVEAYVFDDLGNEKQK